MKRPVTKDIRNLVVKVGTSVLTKNGRFDKAMIDKLAAELVLFLRRGAYVSVVSSGAIGAGMTILRQRKRPRRMQALQAAAAVGQRYLMQCWEQAFSRRGYSTAQVLLTRDDIRQKQRSMNAKHTLKEIQRRGIVPIINENDTVATEEIRFSDNDHLSVLISILLKAKTLVILSDTDGLHANGHHSGRRIPVVRRIDAAIWAHVRDRQTDVTRGGMRSKLKAIRQCVSAGIPVFLAHGRAPRVLSRLFAGDSLGTRFLPSRSRRRV